MKKLLTLLILLIFISCNKEDSDYTYKGTENISYIKSENKNKVEDAINFVNSFFTEGQKKLRAKSSSNNNYTNEINISEQTIDTIYNLNDEENNPFLKLICFNPRGYVLISSIENVSNPPILFYSENRFDKNNINPGLIGYVEEFLDAYIEYSRVPTEDEDRNGDGAWDDGRDTNGSGDPRDSRYYYKETVVREWSETIKKGPLLSTYWHQKYPFNNNCPLINGKRALAGCVAIAIGQILNYHKRNNIKTYNWDRINNPYPYDDNALFIYDIGLGVNMNYGTSGSSASNTAAESYFNRAGYSVSNTDYNYSAFRSSIDNKKPVYLSGASGRKGIWFIIRWGWRYTDAHAWVGDGYKIIEKWKRVKEDRGNNGGGISYVNRVEHNNYIHMNWGWGLDYQENGGWCTYDYFINSVGDDYNFRYKKKMMIY